MNKELNKELSTEVELDAAYQPPMSNGEVLFETPWQGRVFGMAVALKEAGVYEWSEFQASLIEVIGEWDRDHSLADAEPYAYYQHFSEALSRLLNTKGVVISEELSARHAALAARPHGHDHDH